MAVILTIAGILYPVLVVFGHSTVSPPVLVAVACILIGLRVWDMSRKGHPLLAPGGAGRGGAWASTICFAVLMAASLLFAAPGLATKIYPVAASLGVAFVFAASLARPPSLAERMARLREPHLPPEAVSYCRNVTWLWTLWLIANAAIAGGLALWANDTAWALWTGLINYLISGLLFGGEFLVRRIVRKRGAAA